MNEGSDYVRISDVSGSSFVMKGENDMGTDLKGKELGKGISQRGDGRYTARYLSKSGKRIQKYFKNKKEAEIWLRQAKYDEEHSNIALATDITYEEWFNYWLTEIKGDTVRQNTIRNYKERYQHNIKDVIGQMKLSDIKPLHCQQVLNLMKDKYAGSTIEQVKITLYTSLDSAAENEMIPKNPMKKSVKNPKEIEKKKRVLTISEEKKLMEVASSTSNYDQFLFLLRTGMRAGEMIGLKWSDCDFENRKIKIERSMEYRYSTGEYRIGPPKSKAGYREIPMTQSVYDILMRRKKARSKAKVIVKEFSEFVFLNRKGIPTKNSAYDSTLQKLCEKAGIEKISMHTLRHTFATRAIESGVKPKTLQRLLGHANLQTTMNLYVHVTDDELVKAMKIFEDNVDSYQKVV